MSSRNVTKTRKRAKLLQRIQDLGRKISTQTVFLHQAIAQSVGLNATDTKCVDLIISDPNGTVTAGRLSELTGLTTGAITHILDRLEKRGVVERVRDTEDRRRVFVRVRGESLAPLLPKYETLAKAYLSLAEQYSDAELSLICSYMESTSRTTEQLMTDWIEASKK
jgi:DNA-binding MarR family transcriptional regulator